MQKYENVDIVVELDTFVEFIRQNNVLIVMEQGRYMFKTVIRMVAR